MARLDSFAKHTHTPLRTGAPFFNLDADAGPIQFGAYRRPDVQLVQVLLKMIDDRTPTVLSPSGAPIPDKPKRVLTADGTFGPITLAWVRWFQQAAGLLQDGQVSAAPPGRSRGLQTGKVLAIVHLNDIASVADFNRHANLRFDNATPAELKKDLARGL